MHYKTAFLISGTLVVLAVLLFVAKIFVLDNSQLIANTHAASAVSNNFSNFSSNSSTTQDLATSTALNKTNINSGPQLLIDNQVYVVEISDTPEKQTLGLSYRPSLPANHIMLFVFDQPGLYSFWMKDMNFNLDMLWLDSNYKVVTIKENLSPDTYPTSYSPTKPAEYVIEANAGFVQAHNIKVGTMLDITR